MVKKILLSVLGSLLLSFLSVSGFFFLFTPIAGSAAEKIEALSVQPALWIAFGIWSLIYGLFFFTPLLFMTHKKEG